MMLRFPNTPLKSLKSRILGGALAVTLSILSSTQQAKAGAILFDPDGTAGANSAATILGLDFKPGNALAVGSLGAIQRFIANGVNSSDSFTTLFQASLNGYSGTGTTINGLNTTFEITMVASFKEYVFAASAIPSPGGGLGTAKFALAPDQTGSFVQIYYRDLTAPGVVQSNDAAGTNFNNGTLIAEGIPDPSQINLTNFDSFFELPPYGQLDPNNAADTRQTIEGSGSARLKAIINTLTLNRDFFKTLVFGADFNTNLKLAYDEVNASSQFFNGTIPNNALPFVNGLDSPDFQFQADANLSFVAVPEPGTVTSAIAGLALTSFGLIRRRRKA